MWREGGKKDISSTYIHMYKGEEGDAGNWHTFNEGKVAVNPEEARSRPWLASLGRRRTSLSLLFHGEPKEQQVWLRERLGLGP